MNQYHADLVTVVKAPLVSLTAVMELTAAAFSTAVWLWYTAVAVGATYQEIQRAAYSDALAGLVVMLVAFVGLGYLSAALNPWLSTGRDA